MTDKEIDELAWEHGKEQNTEGKLLDVIYMTLEIEGEKLAITEDAAMLKYPGNSAPEYARHVLEMRRLVNEVFVPGLVWAHKEGGI